MKWNGIKDAIFTNRIFGPFLAEIVFERVGNIALG